MKTQKIALIDALDRFEDEGKHIRYDVTTNHIDAWTGLHVKIDAFLVGITTDRKPIFEHTYFEFKTVTAFEWEDIKYLSIKENQ